MENLYSIKRQLQSDLVEKNNMKYYLENLNNQIDIANKKRFTIEQSINIAQQVSGKIQQEVHKQISSIVSSCLTTIFNEDAYGFEIVFEQERNKTTAKLQFTRDGNILNPIGDSGGGVIDVAAFALRTASLILGCSHSRRIMILDEPFRFVSEKYRKNISYMLENLANEFGIQFIIVTHIKELMIGKTIEI